MQAQQDQQMDLVDIGLEAVLREHTSLSRSTKIVCTLGPSAREVPILEEMLKAGMNVARFNFSHGSHEYHQETLDNLRIACKNTKIMCAVMLDTKGPEIRTGFLKEPKGIVLTTGMEIWVTTDYTHKGDTEMIAMSYPHLARDVKPGTQVLCADGAIVMECLESDEKGGKIKVKILNTAKLGERKNVNLPGVNVDLPTLTEKDIDDIQNWGIPNKIDLIAASFVRKGEDLDRIREVLGDAAPNIMIFSKVENQEGLENYTAIVRKSDGVMVARGDLGMEIPTEKIFLAQKMMIQQCNYAGKPVITATQMLDSMIRNPKPTRAEATDVANAVMDGTDCVMLSGETAAGSYPVQTIQVMSRICQETEATLDYPQIFRAILNQAPSPMSPLESLASSAVRTAHKVHAKLILVLTKTGVSSRLVAKYRPSVPVLAVAVPILTADPMAWSCSGEGPARHCLTTRGLVPMLAVGSTKASDQDTTDEMIAAALKQAQGKQMCAPGDCVVAMHRVGGASVLKIVEIK